MAFSSVYCHCHVSGALPPWTSGQCDARGGALELVWRSHRRAAPADPQSQHVRSAWRCAGDKPGFGDAATFNMLRDDQLFHGKMDMAPYPNLKALYEACDAVPAVRKWIEEWEAREV